SPSFTRLQKPTAGRQQGLRIGVVRQYLEPALDTPGIGDSPDLDGIQGQLGGLQIQCESHGIGLRRNEKRRVPPAMDRRNPPLWKLQEPQAAFLAACLIRRSTVGDDCAPTPTQ